MCLLHIVILLSTEENCPFFFYLSCPLMKYIADYLRWNISLALSPSLCTVKPLSLVQ